MQKREFCRSLQFMTETKKRTLFHYNTKKISEEETTGTGQGCHSPVAVALKVTENWAIRGLVAGAKKQPGRDLILS